MPHGAIGGAGAGDDTVIGAGRVGRSSRSSASRTIHTVTAASTTGIVAIIAVDSCAGLGGRGACTEGSFTKGRSYGRGGLRKRRDRRAPMLVQSCALAHYRKMQESSVRASRVRKQRRSK